MNTHYLILPFLLGLGTMGLSQNSTQPDTLLNEPVIGDPISTMLNFPSGHDVEWVNYDADMINGLCVQGNITPKGWFIEGDFGATDPGDTNDAFTSCSYLAGGGQNDNWLILPPIFVPDDSYHLCWRSMPVEGPLYMDGYKVLVSDDSNIPDSGDFSDTLFVAAEMLEYDGPFPPTIELEYYTFSPGYIHANGYTDDNYFYLDPPNGPLRGRLEPHIASLAPYAGKTIYVAFHHDSYDDSLLQIDDIIVTNVSTSGTQQPSNFLDISIMPNPASTETYVKWALKKPEAGQLQLRDQTGKLVLEQPFSAHETGNVFLELNGLAAGLYHCTLQTASGIATRKLVKL